MSSTLVKKTETGEATVHKIRITLSSRNPKAIEKVCSDLMSRAKEQQIKTAGPMRLPTRTLKLTVRKSPCGNGSNTWDSYEMNVYKRVIDLFSPQEVVKQITAINIEPGVDVEVSISDL
eukprot:TRINITY_DN80660_c0_g1_i1.p1 TRINITY_DN80660_c0_g1~~TRINITY_DN80660_c0_g1_i1.p1  ORF type:complete len:119 (-),score=36.94 TRINITY_DN80660_c0_g1_i1:92-448(-)